MAANIYSHKVLTIKLCMENETVKKKQMNIKNPVSDDWNKNLSSLLSKITKKFKFLSEMDESEWMISINGTIIDKSNSQQLKQVLNSTPPVPVVEIIENQEKIEDCHHIIVHYQHQNFDYKITEDQDDWNELLYQDLQMLIRKKFNIDSAFNLYENIDGNKVDIDDTDDILDAFNDVNDENDKNVLHLFVSVPIKTPPNKNAFLISYGDKSFTWIPDKLNINDEKQWDDNYKTLINAIKNKYGIKSNDIQLQQADIECDIDNGEELMDCWQELMDDKDNNVVELNVITEDVDVIDDDDEKNTETKPLVENISPKKNQIMQEYKMWFDDIVRLPQYYALFIQKGYEDLSYLDGDIDEHELIDIGITKKPHRKRLLQEIMKLVEPQKVTVSINENEELEIQRQREEDEKAREDAEKEFKNKKQKELDRLKILADEERERQRAEEEKIRKQLEDERKKLEKERQRMEDELERTRAKDEAERQRKLQEEKDKIDALRKQLEDERKAAEDERIRQKERDERERERRRREEEEQRKRKLQEEADALQKELDRKKKECERLAKEKEKENERKRKELEEERKTLEKERKALETERKQKVEDEQKERETWKHRGSKIEETKVQEKVHTEIVKRKSEANPSKCQDKKSNELSTKSKQQTKTIPKKNVSKLKISRFLALGLDPTKMKPGAYQKHKKKQQQNNNEPFESEQQSKITFKKQFERPKILSRNKISLKPLVTEDKKVDELLIVAENDTDNDNYKRVGYTLYYFAQAERDNTNISPYDIHSKHKVDANFQTNWKIGDHVEIFYHLLKKWVEVEIVDIFGGQWLVVNNATLKIHTSIRCFSPLVRPKMNMAMISTISCHAWNKDHMELAISPNTSDVLIFSAKDGNSENWKRIHDLKYHKMRITGVDWNHATNAIVTVSEDKNACVWIQNENKDWKPTLCVLRIGRAATCVKWSPNGKKFAVGSGSKQIPVCQYAEYQTHWTAKMIKNAGKSSILSVDWSPNNMFVISGGSDFKCRIFSGYIKDVDTDCKIDDYGGAIDSKATSSFGALLWEGPFEHLTHFDTSSVGWIESCVFSTNGMRFAFTGHNSTVHFGSFEGGKTTIQTIKRRQLPLRCIAFLNDTIAIGAGYDCVPILYEYNGNKWIEKGSIDSGAKVNDIVCPYRHKGMINDIEVHSETQFTTSSVDGNVLFWDLKQKY